jgi:uncharacterized repeat protein (TIGR01451 family)
MNRIYRAAAVAVAMCLSVSVWAEDKLLSVADLAGGELSGAAVAISNTTAVVGAPAEDSGAGAVYVFENDGGVWSLQQRITASDAGAPAGATGSFGAAVSVQGDTLAVGAPGHDAARGAVYVFTRSAAVWGDEAIILGAVTDAGDQFGHSVSIDVTTLAIGAPFEQVGSKAEEGVTYAFVKVDGTWQLQQRIVELRGNARAGDHIGWSVALSGNTILSGAPDDDFGNRVNRGSIWVYVRNGSVWTRQVRLNPGGQAGDRAGSAVALFSNVAVIGADGHRVGAVIGQGIAYTYTRTGTAWAKTADLLADDGAAGDHFGGSVAISGPLKLIGAADAATGTGKAYLYGTGGTFIGQLTTADNSAADLFGQSVAIDAGRALIGAPGEDEAGADAGAAYAFEGLVTSTSTEITNIAPEPSNAGDAYTVTVKVTPSPVEPRVVDVNDGDGAQCAPSITLDANGEGSCSLTSIAPGLHTITASFAGNDTYSASQGTAPHDVQGGDLAVTKDDGSDIVVAGQTKHYNIVVSNPGDFNATGVQVVDNLPAELLNPTWVCTPGVGGTCPEPAEGSGNIDQLVDIEAGGSVTFVVTATVVDPLLALFVENTVTINPGANSDENPNNDTATDTNDTALDFIFADGFEGDPPVDP